MTSKRDGIIGSEPPAESIIVTSNSKKKALRFILLLSLIGLLADMTYEGARSISGTYLGLLGASAAAVALIIGFGELIGYTPRLLTGSMTDRTGRYWAFLFVGYGINLVAVPLLAFAGDWVTAAILIIIERAGKAIRAPARDAMLSHAASEVGRGWTFGLNEAITSVGAVLGPVVVALVMMMHGGYSTAFLILIIPATAAVVILYIAWKHYPAPREMERPKPVEKRGQLPKIFWIYVVGASLVAIGYIDFPFLAYHFQKIGSVPSIWIPIFYATANVIDAFGALFFGHVYDVRGMKVLVIITFISSFFSIFVFLNNFSLVLIGIALWGFGAGSQESLMRAVVAEIVPVHKRGSAFGIFSLAFGAFWFLGTAFIGLIYTHSIVAVVAFSFLIQLFAVAVFFFVMKKIGHN